RGLAAGLCVLLGVVPGLWMRYLPGTAEARVFGAQHVGKQLFLLLLGTGAFFLWRWAARRVGRRVGRRASGWLPDSDFLWRRGALAFQAFVTGPLLSVLTRMSDVFNRRLPEAPAFVARNPAGFTRLVEERIRLVATSLFGTAVAVDRAQARFAAQSRRYRTTRPSATWPIGRTALYLTLLLAVALVVWLLG
ncbi:MAG: hypothetical protein ACC662_07395, partial [Planctomycetota bacterium]